MIDSAINRETRIYKEIERIDANRRAVRIWLMVVLVSIVCLVLVGGATRLTDSGLSITEWKPIHGVIPPLSAEEWDEEFRLYQRIPEYQQLNRGMTLAGFKAIFFWEYLHRLLGRLIGVAFALPLIWFWVKKQIPRGYGLRLVALLALGGLQGAIGWWMVVSSGHTVVATGVSSKPATARSRGTSSPLRCATAMVAAAMSSFEAKMAVGA